MSQASVDISIVIPILNEAATLPQLLASLKTQTLKPREVIFVDAGTGDGDSSLIKQWIRQNLFADGFCRVIVNSKGFPGANRNRGIADARSAWIAFLDGGIVPEPDWLENLWHCATTTDVKAVFGCCRFDADSAFQKAVCALSNGCGAVHPVLPASLFHRSVFECTGGFREDLRSAEDLLWLREVARCCGPRVVCEKALVHYCHYPASLSSAAKKWWLYEQNTVRAGLRGGRQWALIAVFATLLLSFLILPWGGVAALFAYLMLRGVLDPMRRSGRVHWWGSKLWAVPIAFGLGIVLDGAKTLGGLIARLKKTREAKYAA